MIKRLLPLILLMPFAANAAEEPKLWGYGVQSCDAYLAAYQGWEDGVDEQIAEYLHYRDWLAGFVSGLAMASKEDPLRGVELEGAMRRIRLQCEEYRDNDFFNSTLAYLSQLKNLEQLPADAPEPVQE